MTVTVVVIGTSFPVDFSFAGPAEQIIVGALEACVPDTPGFFQLRTYAITPTGDTVRFRFTFDTMDHGLNDYPGWFIDDLSVSAG